MLHAIRYRNDAPELNSDMSRSWFAREPNHIMARVSFAAQRLNASAGNIHSPRGAT